jgi:predicted RNA methylase
MDGKGRDNLPATSRASSAAKRLLAWMLRWRPRSAAESAWRSRKRIADREFDARYGVDTGGVSVPRDPRIPAALRHAAVPHIASDPGEFAAAMSAVTLRHADLTFVDIGSGKGRAVIMAAALPFRRILGVEFDARLHRAAVANLRRAASKGVDVARIDLVHGDATCVDLPEGHLLVYLYNPFNREVMQRFVAHVQRSLALVARSLFVCYVNPFFEDVWTEAGFAVVARVGNCVVLAADPPHRSDERPGT